MNEVGGTDAQIIPDTNPSVEEILESMPFEPASRITDADTNNDRRSLDRKLPKSLYLIVKRNREDNSWQFPQGKIKDEESSLREVNNLILF
jgi:8-oxo-dGTP pyrophosphatase MutT (NUDIX family)